MPKISGLPVKRWRELHDPETGITIVQYAHFRQRNQRRHPDAVQTLPGRRPGTVVDIIEIPVSKATKARK